MGAESRSCQRATGPDPSREEAQIGLGELRARLPSHLCPLCPVGSGSYLPW